jgi:hypothetical protein
MNSAINTSYERFQFYCLWKLPDHLIAKLSHYQIRRLPAEELRDLLGLEQATSQAAAGKFLLAGTPAKPFPVAWHNASPYQLLRDSQSNKRGKSAIFYWVAFRGHAEDKVALITVDTSTITTLKPAGELPRGIL